MATDSNADLNLAGTPSLVARDGHKLVLGTAGLYDTIFLRNGVQVAAITSTGFTINDITLPNNTYLQARNAAGTADLDVLKVDATDDVVINASTGNFIKFAINGTSITSIDTFGNIVAGNDINMSGNLLVSVTNKGVNGTSTNKLVIISGGSDGGSTTGAYLQLAGVTNGSLGALFLGGGNDASAHMNFTLGNASALMKFQAAGGGNLITLSSAGSITLDRTNTAGGTTGNQTINKMAGSVNFAIAATAITVTNSLVSTTSNIIAVAQTNDATGYVKNVVPGAGSFVINLVAGATAETRVAFWVFN